MSSILPLNVTKTQSEKDQMDKRLLYCTEAVLDDSQKSNDVWIYDSFVYFQWPDALPGANAW